MSNFQALKNFYRKRNVIILEWKEKNQEKEIFLLLDKEWLLQLDKKKEQYQLIYQKRSEKNFLVTFIYQDQIWGSVRFIGDAYYHPVKQKFVAICWLYGNNKHKW